MSKQSTHRLHLVSSSRLISSTEPEPSPSPSLLPSSDLVSLLSDPDLHSRFREGRYKSGVNHNLRISSLAPCFSATLGSIAVRCPDKPNPTSINTLLNLSAYIGVTAISSWPEIESLITSISLFRQATPTLSGDLSTCLCALIDAFPPPVPVGTKERWYTISGCTDEILAGVGSKIDLSAGVLATLGLAVVLAEQSESYTSEGYRDQIAKVVRSFRVWATWKAQVIRTTVELATSL
jgi:hypothetical protein